MMGDQVGTYRILRQIGEGGMGAVWLAEHSMLGRRAALKMLHPMFSNRRDILTRFFNEARAAASISDPGIVQIFDFGYHVDGNAYIVMELLEGEALDKRLAHGILSIPDALRIMRQVANSLGAAHARGIVHRDLKPENVFLVHDAEVIGGERAKILDFGIAKLFGDTNIKTQTSALLGTPMYMSPEQCRGSGHVDQRSDIYSLGCLLFRMIAGRPPFDAEGAGEIIAMHLREAAPRVSNLVANTPKAVDDLIYRCLEKEPSRRFASGAELAKAIRDITVDTVGSQVSLPVHSISAAAQTSLSASTTSLPTDRRSRRRNTTVIAAISVVLLMAAYTTVAMRSNRDASDIASNTQTVSPPQDIPQPAKTPVASTVAPPSLPLAAPAVTSAPPSSDPDSHNSGPDTNTLGLPSTDAGPTPKDVGKIVPKPDSAKVTPKVRPLTTPTTAYPVDVKRSRLGATQPAPSTASKASAKGSTDVPSHPALAPPPVSSPTTAPIAPPAIAASAPPMSSSASAGPEKLDKLLIMRGMASVRERILACGAGFQGVRVRVSVVVAPAGEVTSVTVKDSPDPWLSSCISSRTKVAHFASTRDGGAFNQRFSF